jgi:4-hydroxy-4-methyl-2-oxoglutarate aldolase
MNAPLPDSLLQQLAGFDSCTIANAIERFDIRLRNEGFTHAGLHCHFPTQSPIVGYAVTLRVRCSNPPLRGGTYLERTDWWDHFALTGHPQILVIEDVDPQPGTGAFVGEVLAAILLALGCRGVVTNGAVRDLPRIETTGFQLFSGSLSPSHAYTHVIEANTPVTVHGLQVQPGDLLHGDRHGLVSVPTEIAAELPGIAAQLEIRERQILALCRSGSFTKSALRTLLA